MYNGNLVTARHPVDSSGAEDSGESYFYGYIRCVRDATIEERNSVVVWNGN